MKSYGKTDIGKVKDNNEDNIFFNDKIELYLVSDGMGGHSAGEIASEMVIDSFKKQIIDFSNCDLLDISSITNDLIISKGKLDSKYHKMGATLVLLIKIDNSLWFLNIGDSRIYHIFHNRSTWVINQITEDHTKINELLKQGKISPKDAQDHPWSHMLSKYFGSEKDNNEPQIGKIQHWGDGDYFLLCSDGLYNMIDNENIKLIIKQEGIYAVDSLISMANKAGGDDNISAIIVQIERRDCSIDHFPTFNSILNNLIKR